MLHFWKVDLDLRVKMVSSQGYVCIPYRADLPLLKVIMRFYTLKWEFIGNTLDLVVSDKKGL